jgi:hypothetical protein
MTWRTPPMTDDLKALWKASGGDLTPKQLQKIRDDMLRSMTPEQIAALIEEDEKKAMALARKQEGERRPATRPHGAAVVVAVERCRVYFPPRRLLGHRRSSFPPWTLPWPCQSAIIGANRDGRSHDRPACPVAGGAYSPLAAGQAQPDSSKKRVTADLEFILGAIVGVLVTLLVTYFGVTLIKRIPMAKTRHLVSAALFLLLAISAALLSQFSDITALPICCCWEAKTAMLTTLLRCNNYAEGLL